MQIIANFSYAGTSKYVSHAAENDRTLCGMDTKELLARSRQEWEYVEEETFLNITHKLSARDVGCKKCSRLLTPRAADEATGCAHCAPRVVGVGLFVCDDCGKTLRR